MATMFIGTVRLVEKLLPFWPEKEHEYKREEKGKTNRFYRRKSQKQRHKANGIF